MNGKTDSGVDFGKFEEGGQTDSGVDLTKVSPKKKLVSKRGSFDKKNAKSRL